MAKGQKQTIMDFRREQRRKKIFFFCSFHNFTPVHCRCADKGQDRGKKIVITFLLLKVSIILNGILRFLQVNNLIIKGDENYFNIINVNFVPFLRQCEPVCIADTDDADGLLLFSGFCYKF
jgi:hypothetical protein